MWKRVLVLSILALIYPVVDSKKRKSHSPKSTKCQRTNSKPFRYCTRSCSTDSDCRVSNSKCLCDGDCGLSCVKNNLKCNAPPSPKNSRQIFSNKTYFGSVVTYSCSKPYKLRGSATRTCRAIRKWDGRKARCRIICKDPGEIVFGNRRYEGSQAGKSIQYWCFDDKYKLVGSARITCLKSGQWSAPKPKCELTRCNPPAIPDTALVFYPRKMPKKFQYSDIVLLQCKDGYFKVGIGTLKCNGNDNWSGGITCSPKSCGRPDHAFSHGRIIGYVYTFKQKVRYTCDEGYTLDGPAYRQCQANEKWSGKDPTCKAVNCGPLNKPDRGDIIEKVAFTFGNRIVFECKTRGYELKGSRIRTCQSNGTWSGSLTSCKLVQCGDPGIPTNGKQVVKKGYVYGGSVTFVCDKDYTLEGTNTTYCQADKSWSAAVPRCLSPCPDPGDPYQGNRIGQDFRHDHTVRFICPRDYIMKGASVIKCSDGRWSNNKPSCKAPCDEPANPAHGWKIGRDFKHGRSVRFYCSLGYQRIGASSTKCNDGTWDSKIPVCKGVCGRPRTPSKGQLHGKSFLDGDEVTFSCDKNYHLFGNAKLRCFGLAWDSPVPQCKENIALSKPTSQSSTLIVGHPLKSSYAVDGIKNTHYSQCTHTAGNTTTNPWWRVDLGQVEPVIQVNILNRGDCCGGRLDGAEIRVGNEITNGGATNHLCADNIQVPQGKSKTFLCRPNAHGRYVSVRIPGNMKYLMLCEVEVYSNNSNSSCKDPEQLKNGIIIGDNYTYGSTVEFRCNKHYRLHGSRFSSCVKGKWNTSIPKCWKNVAFSKPTSQSSTLIVRHPLKSSYAVDGIKNTHFSQCTHTADSTTTNPWWRVDLGQVEPVTQVNILNRGDCCGDKLNGAEIRVGNETTNGGASNHLCADNIQVPQGKSKTFLCRPNALGRYVSIRIPGNMKYLMLCEVEVYSNN